jgi:hypothetical protein
MLPEEREALSGQCSSLSGASNFGVWAQGRRGGTGGRLDFALGDGAFT